MRCLVNNVEGSESVEADLKQQDLLVEFYGAIDLEVVVQIHGLVHFQ